MKSPYFGTTSRIATAASAVAVAGCMVLNQSKEPLLNAAAQTLNPQPKANAPQLDRKPVRLTAGERLQRVAELSKKPVSELSERFQAAKIRDKRR